MLFAIRSIFRSLLGAAASVPLVAGAAGALTLASAPTAHATEDPGPIQMIVQQCVEQIGTSAERTRNLLEARATFGVERIGNLDANDAPVPVMIAAARNATGDLDEIAGNGTRRINRIAFNCVKVLSDNGAPPQAIQIVLQARSAAIASIEAKQRQAKRAIRQALREALEDEEPPGGE